uniref:Ig-like domain-containing protein n=1 Tax=Amphiprion ocellaris TaxID=80972 RepID=A0AAQ5XBA3_AMPOC
DMILSKNPYLELKQVILGCVSLSPLSLKAHFSLNGQVSLPIGSTQFQFKPYELTCLSSIKRENMVYCLLQFHISVKPNKWLVMSFSAVPISNVTLWAKETNLVEYNDTAVLMCSVSNGSSLSFEWLDGNSTVTAGGQVLLSNGNATLTILNVTHHYQGPFRCKVSNGISHEISAPVHLNITMLHEPFTLQCEVAGSADTILWWMNGQPISADNATVFGMNNKTLTLNSVQPSDNGHYKCQAFNSVSNMTSSPYTVNVICKLYGPEMPTITGPTAVKTGDNVTFSCYASSNPPSHYKWYFNGSLVSNMSEYITPHLPKETVRKYICMAFNNVTGQNSSAYIMLTVVGEMWIFATYMFMQKCFLKKDYTILCFASFSDPIENVQVEAPDNLATEGNSYNLTCNVTGPADHVYWMKNGELLHENNRTVFSMDNKTVSFIPLNHYDTGDYQCMAVNAVGNMTSPLHMLLVNCEYDIFMQHVATHY